MLRADGTANALEMEMQIRVYLIILRALVMLQPAAACAMGDVGPDFGSGVGCFQAQVCETEHFQ